MYRTNLKLGYAISELLFLGGYITYTVDPQPGQNLCHNLLSVPYTELTY